jgi:glutamyl-tRNA synthetase
MTDKQIRVRFAPSPTGFLHVGGARTALFNWLFVRHHGGVFVLRIEDTDRERSDDTMTQAILDGMQWLGLTWDEGPFHQADGIETHRADALRLLENGLAYRCFCTTEELEARRKAAGNSDDAYRYDRKCLLTVSRAESDRRAAAGEPFTIRFQVPEGVTAWDDAVYGNIEFDNASIEDFIILRTDGTPIYNLAVVSDDVAMRITHVLRGDDHVSNTPKQIMLYNALGAELPVFGHLPMILGPDGKRLSKRHGATAVGEYHAQGILPQAMVNFLALLGWSPGTEQEIFEVDELIQQFSLDGINRKGAIFDARKLEWLNGQHMSRMAAEMLAAIVSDLIVAAGLADAARLERERDWFLRVLDLVKVRARSYDDVVEQARPYFGGDVVYEPEAVEKYWKDPEDVSGRLEALRDRLAKLPEWSEPALETALRELANQQRIGAGKLIHPLRLAVTGAAVSPGVFEVLGVMGKGLVLARLDRAISTLRGLGAEQVVD